MGGGRNVGSEKEFEVSCAERVKNINSKSPTRFSNQHFMSRKVWGTSPPNFITNPNFADIKTLVNSAKLDDEQIIKLAAQLEYHQDHDPANLVERSTQIVDSYTTPKGWKFPRVRFGKTEIMMPIVTTGGMRYQQSWAPDTLPITVTNSQVDQICKDNLLKLVRRAISLGAIHFETARAYGTSEYQLVDVLGFLIESGEVRREDIIIQTKIPPKNTNEEFEKAWAASWRWMKQLKYVDLFAYHGISKVGEIDKCIAHFPITDKLVAEGKIKHVGFSTHGCPDMVKKAIMVDKFEFVNLHCTYFGSYHASMEDVSCGGRGWGNEENCRMARERDMGLFVISPYDKGGKLYKPSRKVCDLVGKEITPMEFNSIYTWEELKVHTFTVGIARSSDFDECVSAARKYDERGIEEMRRAKERLNEAWVNSLGEHWSRSWYKGIVNHHDPKSKGVAIAMILWLHNCMSAWGLWEFAKERYGSFLAEAKKWDDGKSFEYNLDKMNSFNTGLPLPEATGMDFVRNALEGSGKSEEDLKRIMECLLEVGDWCDRRKTMGVEEQIKLGFECGYSLGTWEQFPGDNAGVKSVVFQNLARKFWYCCCCLRSRGVNGGPNKEFREFADQVRGFFK